MAWDDSEFISPDYSSYDFDPQRTDYFGADSYSPDNSEAPSFDLYDQLAQQGIIGQDQYGMPDISALYSGDPTVLPGQEAPAQLPSELSLGANVDPALMSGVQEVGPGTYLLNGQLMDSVQMQDYLTRMSQPGMSQMQGLQSSPFGPSNYPSDLGITGMYSPAGDPRSQQFMTLGPGELRDSGGVGTPLGEGLTDPYFNERLSSEGPNYIPLMKLLDKTFGGTTSSASKTATLPLQQRDAQGNLTKAQTGLNTAAMMTMIAEAMRNKSVSATPGTGDSRGADAWSVGRAAGSGRKKKAEGGLVAYARGGHVSDPRASGGQADTVHAALSGGEYIMDADIVSALGDGDTNAGAAKLDQMREAVRKHKRSAPSGKIPPKAKSPLEYMKGAR